MYFLGFFDNIKDGLFHAVIFIFRYLFLTIDKYIYQFIVFAYNIFIRLTSGKLLDSGEINKLFGRIGLILGLIMLFRVAFSFIQLLIDPDSFGDSKKGMTGVIKKTILVVVMLGMSTYVFNLLENIQAEVIKDNVIPKLLLPYEINDTDFGKSLSGNTFNSLIYENGDTSAAKECNADNFEIARLAILADMNYDYMAVCLNEYDDNNDNFIYEYNFIAATIVGVVMAWLVFSYCISVGVRLIQLTVLQIISPVAMIGYLSPKDENLFSNWLKKYIGTYLDIFIRIIIINFAVYLIALILGDGNAPSTFWDSVGDSKGLEHAYIQIVMILAILSFAKKAPDLIKSLFPGGMLDSGLGFGIEKPGETLAPLGRAAGFGAGALVGGGLSASARYHTNANLKGSTTKDKVLGALGGFASGATRGALAGGKSGNMISNLKTGVGNIRTADNNYDEFKNKGGTIPGMLKSKAADLVATSRGQKDRRQLEQNKYISDKLKGILDMAEQTSHYKQLMHEKDHLSSSDPQYRAKADALQARADAYAEAYLDTALQNNGIVGDYVSYEVNGVNMRGQISGGDQKSALQAYTDYLDVNSYVDTTSVEYRTAMDVNANTSVDRIGSSYSDVKAAQKAAQMSQSYIVGTEGYSKAQTNMGNNNNNEK